MSGNSLTGAGLATHSFDGFVVGTAVAHESSMREIMRTLDNFEFDVVPKKYRGTPEYTQIRNLLIRAAQSRGTTTYGEIAVIMGLPPQGNHMSKETGHLLGEIAEDESRAGRPMLTAVAVTIAGTPGVGFFRITRDLGKFGDGTNDEESFWRQQLEAVYDAWSKKQA